MSFLKASSLTSTSLLRGPMCLTSDLVDHTFAAASTCLAPRASLSECRATEQQWRSPPTWGVYSPTPMPSESAYQLVVFSHDQARVFPLPAVGEVLLGRDEAIVIRTNDPSVSRQHAILRVGNSLEIEDLGGANGTFVRRTAHHGGGNDTAHVNLQQLVRRKATITVGDCLLFGTVSVVVRHAPRVELPELLEGDVPATPGRAGAVVRDPAMRRLHAEAARVARASINVLLTGETGVGKEVLARAIHAYSPRAKGPFMGLTCAALDEPLLESA